MDWQLTTHISIWSTIAMWCTLPLPLDHSQPLGKHTVHGVLYHRFLAFATIFRKGHKAYYIPRGGGQAFSNAHTRGSGRTLWFPIDFRFHSKANMESKRKRSMQSTRGTAPKMSLQASFAA